MSFNPSQVQLQWCCVLSPTLSCQTAAGCEMCSKVDKYLLDDTRARSDCGSTANLFLP